jgi:ceramide glucosyltransferase
VAGIATRCGQKNHNLLAAIDAHGDAEVYLFCDAKVRPSPDWIARMVEPFSLKGRTILGVTAMCSGGRFSDWSLPHIFQQQIATWQSAGLTSCIGGVWGSSMALRRADWERLGLRETWAGTIVDDVTTFSRLLREGRGTMLAALDAYPNPGYSMRTFGKSLDWGIRQSLYVRYCLPQYWVPTLLENVVGIACLVWPLALLTSEPGTAWRLFGLVCLGCFVPCAIVNVTMKRPTGIELPWPRYLLLAPFWDVIWMVLSVGASQEDGVAWRGIQYDLDRYGRVLSITRDDVNLLPAEVEAAEAQAARKTAKVTA